MIFRFNATEAKKALDHFYTKLVSIQHVNEYAGPLMENWERQMIEDNRWGVLAGTDKDGHPAPPLRYRPVGKPQRLTDNQRLGQDPRARRGRYVGRGPAASGLNNNLTTSEYRRLGGTRLAPRKQFSRSITNYATVTSRDGQRWVVTGSWVDVVNTKGKRFLRYHFLGMGRNPLYDLRGIRPRGRERMLVSMRNWVHATIRKLWGS